MNNQFQQNQRGELDSSKFVNKKSYRKFVLRFVVVVVGAFVLLIMVAWGWQKYRYWQDEKIAQKAEEGIRKWQQEDYERAMADTYGGKTPQETLQMYIDAVEKGDYELASRYFVLDKQERELNYLISLSDNEKLSWFLEKMLKGAFIESGEYRDIDEKHYRIEIKSDEPNIYYSIIYFFKYPNNTWKINEISPENF